MPKAQVLVTLTAEALVDVPEGIEDVEAYCREHVGLSWGELPIAAVVQPETQLQNLALPCGEGLQYALQLLLQHGETGGLRRGRGG